MYGDGCLVTSTNFFISKEGLNLKGSNLEYDLVKEDSLMDTSSSVDCPLCPISCYELNFD